MRLLKSKWLTIGLAVAFAVALLWWAIATVSKDTYRSENLSVNNSVRSLLSSQAQQDGDNDGLKDWEEVLWNTSPSNPDTDGDGTLDGEEVVAGRNPATAGPDDTLTQIEIENKTNISDENLTLTDKFAREFLSSYLTQKQQGNGTVGAAFEEELLNKALDQDAISKGRVYTKSDVRVTLLNDPQSVRDYANAVGKTFRINSLPQSAYDPLLILQKAFETEDTSETKKLEDIYKTSGRIVSDLLVTSVPSDLADEHVSLLNAMSAVSENFKGMSEGLNDPLKAMLHVQMYYNVSVAQMRNSVKSIGDYLREQGIVFQQSEDGTLIMNTI